jgi:hypothetical protein
MAASTKKKEQHHHRDHLCQFYCPEDPMLATNVAKYLGEGLRAGDSVLMIATPGHLAEFLRRLEADATTAQARLSGRVEYHDAQETLNTLLVDGQPHWDSFDSVIRPLIEQHRARSASGKVRVYGEMVGLLWQQGNHGAAIQLEDYWNAVLESLDFSLYCAYPVDIFRSSFDPALVSSVLDTHSEMIGGHKDYGVALDRAIDDTLGAEGEVLKLLIKAHYRPESATIPRAEAIALWLRANAHPAADAIFLRAANYYPVPHLLPS